MLGKRGFRGTILYRIKVLPSHHPSPLQNQDLIDPKKNGLMEMILLQNQEPAFCIWHLSTKSKPIGVGKKGFQGNYSLQNQGPSLSPSLTSTESRSDRPKEKWSHGNDITTESRTCILHLTSLYKIKTRRCWEKGVSGELFSTESRSFPLTIPHLYRIKIWRYDIDEHVFTTKSKTLRHHQPYFLQNQFLTQNVRFCALPAGGWGP